MDTSKRGRLKRRLGRRGAILLSYGALWLMFAYASILLSQLHAEGNDPLHRWLPTWAIVTLWAGTGLLAGCFAFVKHRSDTIGFFALYLMPTLMFASHMVAWLYFVAGDPHGARFGWLNAISFISLSVPIVICAGWAEGMKKEELT